MAKFVEAPSPRSTKSYYINLDSVACVEQSSQKPNSCSVYFNQNSYIELAISAAEFVRRAQSRTVAKRVDARAEGAVKPAPASGPGDTRNAASERSLKQG